jgi:hypothetical protein
MVEKSMGLAAKRKLKHSKKGGSGPFSLTS